MDETTEMVALAAKEAAERLAEVRRREKEAAELAIRQRLSFLWHMGIESHGVKMMLELMTVGSIDDVTPELLDGALMLWADQRIKLSQTELMIATDEICNVLKVAGPAYPGSQIFLKDVMVPYGMVWFADPIDNPTPLGDDPYYIRALSWTLDMPGSAIYVKKGHTHKYPLLTIIGYTDMSEIARKSPARSYVNMYRSDYPEIYPVSSIAWEVDPTTNGTRVDLNNDEQAATMRLPYVKALMAFWATIRQRLILDEEPTYKISPKQLKHAKLKNPKLNTSIKILRMRPRKRTIYTGDHGFNRPHYTVQWPVIPHWRKKRNPVTGETIDHILIWTYLKGPDDAPLINAERAFLPPPPRPEI